MKEVVSFGEDIHGKNQWYLTKQGVKIECEEVVMDALYDLWYKSPHSYSESRSDGSTVYKVIEPIKIEL